LSGEAKRVIAIQEGVVIAGKYRLERSLARGGMGAVWLGRHLELGTSVAVKFIDAVHAASESARSRFKREAKAAAQLNTPHVVKVYDYGVEDGTPYLVMELLEGEDLGTRLKRAGRLSLAATATLLTPVCKALHRAHEIGLVHRDLKPANIFIARQDDDEVVKVLDFGIAKWTDADDTGHATQPGSMLGSPLYMSPEQARSLKDLDHRSDLWSLGVVAFRAMTGRLPFEGASLPAVIMAICAEPIPLPSQFVPDLGPDVDGFFARALARDPAQRFQSAREFAVSLVALSGRSEVSGSSASFVSLASTEPRSALGSSPTLRDSSASRREAETPPLSATLSAPRRAPRLWAALGAVLVALVAAGVGFFRSAGTVSTVPLPPSAEPTPVPPASSPAVPVPPLPEPEVVPSAAVSSSASGALSAAPAPVSPSAPKVKPKPSPLPKTSPQGSPSAGGRWGVD
jgi:eukaryotic-like serine/threonine-protein kinase